MHSLLIVARMVIVPMCVGALMLCVSNVQYYRRTRDPKFWTRFWLGRDLLTRREYVLNRAGLALVVVSASIGAPCLAAIRYGWIAR